MSQQNNRNVNRMLNVEVENIVVLHCERSLNEYGNEMGEVGCHQDGWDQSINQGNGGRKERDSMLIGEIWGIENCMVVVIFMSHSKYSLVS